jgi:hypothetical protein
MDLQNHLKKITELYAANRLGEAWQATVEVARSHQGDHRIFDLLHKIRSDSNSLRQIELLADIGKSLRWINASVTQQFVQALLRDPRFDDSRRLERFGFSVASQNEEDGMVAEIFRRIGVTNRTFFEFGVGTGLQNMTMCLLLSGWSGVWIEIHKGKAQFIREKFADVIRAGRLRLGCDPVTAENINRIAEELQVPEEIDFLSIDIDGNDYHVFKALKTVNARVICLEYNPLYPPPMSVVMDYDPNYVFEESTYVGCSLQALTELAESKGYQLVGCSISGVNALYVRKDLAVGKFFEPATPSHFYHGPKYQLSFSGGFGWGPKSNFTKLIDVGD